MNQQHQPQDRPHLIGNARPLKHVQDLFVDGFQDEPDMLAFIDEVRGRNAVPDLQRFVVAHEQPTDPDINAFLDEIRGS